CTRPLAYSDHRQAPSVLSTLSLHDALPISGVEALDAVAGRHLIRDTLFKYHAACYLTHAAIEGALKLRDEDGVAPDEVMVAELRSEEHTSELQSRSDLVCRLLLEKKKTEPLPPTSLTVVHATYFVLWSTRGPARNPAGLPAACSSRLAPIRARDSSDVAPLRQRSP